MSSKELITYVRSEASKLRRTNIRPLTKDTTVKPADTGTTFLSNPSSDALAITLPTDLEAGLTYKFIVKTKSAAVTIGAGSAIIVGEVIADGGTSIPITAGGNDGTSVTLTTSAVKGDFLELVCDGTNWYANGYTGDASGFTVA